MIYQGMLCNSHITTLNVVAPITNVQALCNVLTCATTTTTAPAHLECLKLWTSATSPLTREDLHRLGDAMERNTSLQELWLGIPMLEESSTLQQSSSSCLVMYDEYFFACLARRSQPLRKLHLRGEKVSAPTVTTTTTTLTDPQPMMIDGEQEEEEDNRTPTRKFHVSTDGIGNSKLQLSRF